MADVSGAGGSSALMDAYQLVEAILRSSELGGKGELAFKSRPTRGGM